MMEVVVTTGAIRRGKLQPNHHHQHTNTQTLDHQRWHKVNRKQITQWLMKMKQS